MCCGQSSLVCSVLCSTQSGLQCDMVQAVWFAMRCDPSNLVCTSLWSTQFGLQCAMIATVHAIWVAMCCGTVLLLTRVEPHVAHRAPRAPQRVTPPGPDTDLLDDARTLARIGSFMRLYARIGGRLHGQALVSAAAYAHGGYIPVAARISSCIRAWAGTYPLVHGQ